MSHNKIIRKQKGSIFKWLLFLFLVVFFLFYLNFDFVKISNSGNLENFTKNLFFEFQEINNILGNLIGPKVLHVIEKLFGEQFNYVLNIRDSFIYLINSGFFMIEMPDLENPGFSEA